MLIVIIYGINPTNLNSLTSNVKTIHEKPDIKTYARNQVGEDQWESFNNIIQHESGWCHTKWNGQNNCPEIPRNEKLPGRTSAYGLCQTMLNLYETDTVSDFRINPYAQVDWCIAYAYSRYESPNKAWLLWKKNRWW